MAPGPPSSIRFVAPSAGHTRHSVRARMDIGRALDLCRTAANLIFSLGGGSGIARSNPVQRLFRDVQAGNSHPLQMATVQYEVYGRHMLGQPQITSFI